MRNLCDNAGHTGDTYAYSGDRSVTVTTGNVTGTSFSASAIAAPPKITAQPGSQMAGHRAVLGGGEGALRC